jgi:outer membrane protein OmpA-like peptidoglycan-associated protein
LLDPTPLKRNPPEGSSVIWRHDSAPRRRWCSVLLGGLALVCLVSAPPVEQALAQSSGRRINTLGFEPSVGPNGIWSVETSATLPNLKWAVGAHVSYANDPLVVKYQGDTVYRLVGHQLLMDLTAAMGIWWFFEVGVHLPVALYQRGSPPTAVIGDGVSALTATALGDLRVVPKVRFWPNRKHGFGLALLGQFTLPTGRGLANVGEASATFEPRVALDYRFRQGTILALNLGYRLRKSVEMLNLRVDDEVYWGLGAQVPVWRRLAVVGEVYGAVGLRDAALDPDPGIDAEEIPLEVLLGARYRLGLGVTVSGGVGVGVTNGFGTPDFRVFFGVRYETTYATERRVTQQIRRTEKSDRDKDGIEDHQDNCPDTAEDKDGYRDTDGCPDPDNDKDGVCDPHRVIQKHLKRYAKICTGRDMAPLDPEDLDGFQDHDGKPDPDNDKDGLCDPGPVIQKHLARYQKICRWKDACPNAAEDKDGFDDDDGCPDPDNDLDGVCDAGPSIQGRLAQFKRLCRGSDACPNKTETINGSQDADGCPDGGAPLLKVTRTRIQILAKLRFRSSGKVRRKSRSVVSLLAKTLLGNPWITKVRIEGHTARNRSNDRSLMVSLARAQKIVQSLRKAGVSDQRMLAMGFGGTRPTNRRCHQLRSSRARRRCRRTNERIDIIIIETALPRRYRRIKRQYLEGLFE